MAFSIAVANRGVYSGDWPNWKIDQYFDRVFYACQQMDFRLAGLIPVVDFDKGAKQMWVPISKAIDGTSGKSDTMANGMVTAIAGTDYTDIRTGTARYSETRAEYPETLKRRMTTVTWEYNPFLARKDVEARLGNPNDAITTNAIAGFNRKKDYTLITALGADVYEGYDALDTGAWTETTVSFPSTQIIDSTGSEPMNDDKLEDAYELWLEGDVDFQSETPVYICGPRQWKNMRGEQQYINYDYTRRSLREQRDYNRLPDGTIIIVTNQLPVTAEGVRTTYLFLPTGLIHGVEEEMYQSIAKRTDRKDGAQIIMEHSSGCSRVLDEKVIKILCAETAEQE